jgi:hypothetical protein
VEILLTPGAGANGSVLVVGAIGDYGKTQRTDGDGAVDQFGNYIKLKLQQGSFEMNFTAFNQALTAAPTTWSATTCSDYYSASAPSPVIAGTGLYSGISGTVTVTGSFAYILPRYTSGKDKGKCNTSNNVQPVSRYSSMAAAGKVSYGASTSAATRSGPLAHPAFPATSPQWLRRSA